MAKTNLTATGGVCIGYKEAEPWGSASAGIAHTTSKALRDPGCAMKVRIATESPTNSAALVIVTSSRHGSA